MTDRATARAEILELIRQARALIPQSLLDRLPPSTKLDGEPEWHGFEHPIWQFGEGVRQLQLPHPVLRKDPEIQGQILEIALDRRAHRGRQSFVMLLGHKCCSTHAPRVANELCDPCVDGHVIWSLYRMRAHGFAEKIRPFASHQRTWIRKEAKRYLAWDGDA